MECATLARNKRAQKEVAKAGGEGGGGDEQNVNERKEVEMAEGGAGGGGCEAFGASRAQTFAKMGEFEASATYYSCTSLVILLHILLYDNNSINCVIII